MTLPCGTHDLRRDEANLSSAAAEIEDGLAFAQILARIAAAVIALDYLLRNDFQVLGVVIDGATKLGFGCFRSGGVAFTDFGFGVDGAHNLVGFRSCLSKSAEDAA